MSAAITSSTHDRKSRCSIFFKNDRIYLKSSSLGDDVPIVIILKAMGIESDQEIVQLIGSEPEITDVFSASLEEPYNMNIFSQQQVSIIVRIEVIVLDFVMNLNLILIRL